MNEDKVELNCPCCNALILFDEAGQPYTEQQELQSNQHRGLGNLVSTEACGTDWRKDRYGWNAQTQYTPPPQAVTNGMPNLNAPVEEQVPFPSTETDEDIEKVHMADLREHGFAAKDPTLQHKQNNN